MITIMTVWLLRESSESKSVSERQPHDLTVARARVLQFCTSNPLLPSGGLPAHFISVGRQGAEIEGGAGAGV